jgi:cytochrome c oxidase cbb3-type subunit 3
MGPPLMDERWIYGSDPGHIFETIVGGRPNGMPAFGGRISDEQVWQLVAFVQSMSGHAPVPSLPGRSDHLQAGPPENNRPAEPPIEAGSQ